LEEGGGDMTKEKKSCFLCGATKELTKTDCCNHWICDDEDKYVLFSYARNSCHRNHDRYTLCAHHYREEHDGDSWQTCVKCKGDFDTEDYVYYGTNEYNHTKLKKPPKFKKTKCSKCKAVMDRASGGFSSRGDEFLCMNCTESLIGRFPDLSGP
jgi:hypothetical protein